MSDEEGPRSQNLLEDGVEAYLISLFETQAKQVIREFLLSHIDNDKLTEQITPVATEEAVPPNYTSIGPQGIEQRFGFHKATLEGPNATSPRHANLREEFKKFATLLDAALPVSTAKINAFHELEVASMWAHKAIARDAADDVYGS